MTPPMLLSDLCAHAMIADINLDGAADVVKNTTLHAPFEVAALYNEAINAVIEDSKGIEIPDTVLLPIAHLNLLATTRLGTVNDTTMLEYIETKNAASSAWTSARWRCSRYCSSRTQVARGSGMTRVLKNFVCSMHRLRAPGS